MNFITFINGMFLGAWVGTLIIPFVPQLENMRGGGNDTWLLAFFLFIWASLCGIAASIIKGQWPRFQEWRFKRAWKRNKS